MIDDGVDYVLDPSCEEFRVDPNDFDKDNSRKTILSGGYGSISFQIQKSTKIKCVCKKTNESLSLRTTKRSFYREIEILSKCFHPSIVQFIGFSEANGFGYIYLVEAIGGSLKSLLDASRAKHNPNLTNTLKYIISYGIAVPMEYLHSQNKVHRDLKPGNILLDEQLHPLLTDFGTAKQIDSSVKINQTLGGSTSVIMSPEFFEEPELHSNKLYIDVYSYGMTLYELWTELVPFSTLKTNFQVCNAVITGLRPPIPDTIPDIWKDLIERCWNQNPDSRPTFKEILEEFNTDQYYTPDMDKAKIEEYKKLISVKPTTTAPEPEPERVEETETEAEPEPEQPVEHPLLTTMRKNAEAGDANSQFNLITALVDGTYGPPNYEEAIHFCSLYLRRPDAFNDGNKKNSAMIEYYKGRCFVEAENYTLAVQVLKQSVSHGCADAAFFLAELMFTGKAKFTRNQELLGYYELAAKEGVAEAVKKYAYILHYGTITGHPDMKKSIQFIQMGSDQGDPEMMYLWSVRLEFGRGVDKDVPKAMNLMKLAAEKGYTPAMVDYGMHLLNGINVPKNEDEAKVRFHSAAALDDHWGQLWYYVMSKNYSFMDTVVLDEDLNEMLTNSLSVTDPVPEAWAVYGRELIDDGNIDEALSPLFYACSFGSINGFLCLGELCEDDSKYGDPKYYFELASNYCHCLGSKGYTTPIQYKVFHCLDCEVDICEGCAKFCHADHNTTETIYKRGFVCKCGEKGFVNKCSCEFIGETHAYQHLFQCKTCCFSDDTKYICKSCAENCHKDHQIIDCGIMRENCSCGLHNLPYNFKCKLLQFERFDHGCSCGQYKQRWFQCCQCGLYGSNQVGVCQACAKVCHDTHNLLDLGVKEATCSCKNANCLLQDD